MENPTLYKFYNDDYNYTDLEKAYNAGLEDYLRSLKRGIKDQEEFITAGQNLMNGIKTGRVTWDGTEFHDSEGEYTNSTDKNKSKDYMGLMAHYIYKLMGEQKKYEAPEKKIDDLSVALNKNIFGSDTADWVAWNQLDTLDSKFQNRTQALYNALVKLKSDPNYADKIEDIDKALIALQDHTIDNGDYMALSKLGIDYQNFFNTQGPKKVYQSNIDALKAELLQKFPITEDLYTRTLNMGQYGNYTLQQYINQISQVSDENLLKALQIYITNPEQTDTCKYPNGKKVEMDNSIVVYLLTSLGLKRGLFNKLNDDIIYLNGLDNPDKFTSYVYDKKSGSIKEVSSHYIPKGQQTVRNWLAERQKTAPNNSVLDQYFTTPST